MVLGALVELIGSADWLVELPRRLKLPGVSVEVAAVMRSAIKATKVTVRLGRATEEPGDVSDTDFLGIREHRHDHDSGHGHHHHHASPGGSPDHRHAHLGGTHHHDDPGHAHRHVSELLALIADADLPPQVKATASAAFRRLAAAEGKIHGVAPERVALHEVGAYDAVIDIVGSALGFELLGVASVVTRPLALGSGWVRAAHGVLPVPTPATSLLIEGLSIGPDGPVEGEATTPTGAALLQALTGGHGPVGRWRAVGCGYGAGGRDPGHYPNVLKILLAEPLSTPSAQELVMVSTDIDDLSPEYLTALRDELVTAGAVDVVSWSTQMKKGRIGFRVEALTQPEQLAAVAEAFFRHSTTAGLRTTTVSRQALPREHWSVPGPGGVPVRVKTLHGPAGPRVKPEYDDVIAAAKRAGQPAHELARRLEQEALGHARQGTGSAGRHDNDPPKEPNE